MTALGLSTEATQDLTFMQRVMVQHAHPLKLCCDSTGVVVGLHLIWRHRLPAAVTALLGSSILGSLLVQRAGTRQLAATWLGRWMLGQARPVNLVVRTAGFVVLLAGVWRHSTGVIVSGAGAIVAARPLSSRSLRLRAQRPLRSSGPAVPRTASAREPLAAHAGGSGERAVGGVSPSHRGRAGSARRSRATRTSWSRSGRARRLR